MGFLAVNRAPSWILTVKRPRARAPAGPPPPRGGGGGARLRRGRNGAGRARRPHRMGFVGYALLMWMLAPGRRC